MNVQRLHQQIDEYALWKRELIQAIMRYRSWLAHNQLDSPALLKQLENNIQTLRRDHITLAFLGEYSRGKTELINSLFFSSFGQRLLPSQAGRTTMSPTEIYFDSQHKQASLRLLPIETRTLDDSLTQLKQEPEHWLEITLDEDDADSLSAAFAHIAQNKSVAIEEAIALGFLPEGLERAEQADHVLIPTWRHALINIDHPLLRQGLRVIDTPGLNALGSEPELTLSLLPSAQAIILVLSADTGVTASDLTIWQQVLDSQRAGIQSIQCAVLNKIDTLWDSLSQDRFAKQSIQLIQQQTAQQLKLPSTHVLPVSAKRALQAKICNDQDLLEHSNIDALETFLSDHIISQKQLLLEQHIVQPLRNLLHANQKLIQQRVQLAQLEQQQLKQQGHSSTQVLLHLLEQAKNEHQSYYRRLLSLKTNQRLLTRQGELLCAQISPKQLKNAILTTQKQLTSSWTTLGINQAISDFFTKLEHTLQAFEAEALMANKMVRALYLRHNSEYPLFGVEAPQLRTHKYRLELTELHNQADQFRRNLKTLLSSQNQLSRRFIATLVQEVIDQRERLRHQALLWSNEALTPLIQQNLEQKQLLENHILRLKALAQSTQDSQQRNHLLSQLSSELNHQLIQINEILRILRRPPPQRRQAKVVQLGTQRNLNR